MATSSATVVVAVVPELDDDALSPNPFDVVRSNTLDDTMPASSYTCTIRAYPEPELIVTVDSVPFDCLYQM